MTDVLIKKKKKEREKTEGHVETEAETAVFDRSVAATSQGPPGTTRCWKRQGKTLPYSSGGATALHTP